MPLPGDADAQIDIDRTYFPDPAGMNRQLHDWGMHSIISVWPRFERRPDRVRRELAGARSGAGAREQFDLVECRALELAGLMRTDRLPHVLDRQQSRTESARTLRPAIQNDRRLVDSSERHQRAGTRLVASDDGDECVEVVRDVQQLDRVCD